MAAPNIGEPSGLRMALEAASKPEKRIAACRWWEPQRQETVVEARGKELRRRWRLVRRGLGRWSSSGARVEGRARSRGVGSKEMGSGGAPKIAA